MSWYMEYEGVRFPIDDDGMKRYIKQRYRDDDEAVRQAFADWVNEEYTPWEALESTHDAALELWAQHLVHDRPDLIPGLLPLVKEVRE